MCFAVICAFIRFHSQTQLSCLFNLQDTRNHLRSFFIVAGDIFTLAVDNSQITEGSVIVLTDICSLCRCICKRHNVAIAQTFNLVICFIDCFACAGNSLFRKLAAFLFFTAVLLGDVFDRDAQFSCSNFESSVLPYECIVTLLCCSIFPVEVYVI